MVPYLPNLGYSIVQTSKCDAPPWAPNATFLQSGDIFKSSIQYVDYLLGIVVKIVFAVSIIYNVFGSNKYTNPLRSPQTINLLSDDQSTALTSLGNGLLTQTIFF